MLNLLNTSVGEYLRDNVVLTVVLALILALIAALAGIMIYLQLKAKKNGNMEASQNSEPLDEGDQTEEPATTPQEEPAAQTTQAVSYEEPVTEKTEETPKEEPAKQEATTNEIDNQKTESDNKTAQKKPSTAKKPAAKKPAKSEEKVDEKPVGFQDGKWVINKTNEGKYTFQLFASNGSVMLESSKEYSSRSTAKQGIETYKKNFAENHCKIVSTKTGHFVYRLTNANGMLLAVSPSYTSKSSCENALESTKTYAESAPVEVDNG